MYHALSGTSGNLSASAAFETVFTMKSITKTITFAITLSLLFILTPPVNTKLSFISCAKVPVPVAKLSQGTCPPGSSMISIVVVHSIGVAATAGFDHGELMGVKINLFIKCFFLTTQLR